MLLENCLHARDWQVVKSTLLCWQPLWNSCYSDSSIDMRLPMSWQISQSNTTWRQRSISLTDEAEAWSASGFQKEGNPCTAYVSQPLLAAKKHLSASLTKANTLCLDLNIVNYCGPLQTIQSFFFFLRNPLILCNVTYIVQCFIRP